MRIAFIEPRNDRLNVFSRYNLPRLGSVLLATILKEKGYDCRVYFVSEKEIPKLRISCDLVAISTITSTAPQAYRIADYFHRQNLKVIMGGPHVTFLPEEALAHADYCVLGEGEETLPELVAALNLKGPVAQIPNLAYWENGKPIYTARKPFLAPLDSLPFPDFSLLNYGRGGVRHSLIFKKIIPIQTSRGCPYDCTFCSVTGMFGKHYRFRSKESILAELARYNHREHKIFFYDDNFAANRRRTKELLEAMLARGLQFTWSTQVRAEIAKDPELLKLMYQAGCRVVFIGFESINPDTLKEMKKSQTAEDIRYAVRTIQQAGIHVHGMFVFGFDTDTPTSIRETVRFAIKERIDTAQFMILTPLPGSEFFKQMRNEGRIISSDWSRFDAQHVTFKPKRLSVLQLQLLQIEAHTRFYTPFNILRKLFRNRWVAFFVGLYAHKLNVKWKKMARKYLALLKRLSQQFSLTAVRDV